MLTMSKSMKRDPASTTNPAQNVGTSRMIINCACLANGSINAASTLAANIYQPTIRRGLVT